MLSGFKEFIMKGNVMDLAVAVIIGAAFSKIVNALVESVLMPAISAVVGSPNLDTFAVVTLRGNDLKFGVLLTAIVNFLLIAAAVYFCIVLPMNKMIERRNRRMGIEPTTEPADPNTVLLTEIRDALKGHPGAVSTEGRHSGPAV
ncbi:large conductance mechanosensitive channel protein MscL [Kocuria tytonis]|uniref:Large-conductance mechanosensitive channel n=1 Tax=Kocuria tytonis TaxID=2054280 RepID=A0A495AAV1_9MICC|nr:large conductance mechanosensitive channel protein MscL [Kocuria tytonis]RKQ36903.1 large conductance mechanosensitive channel protein MscL [Kocuria tytonis]